MGLWRVRDVMTTDVVSIGEYAPYRDIVDLLTGCRISGVPVVDYFGHVAGVVSEADLLHRVETDGLPPRRHLFDGRRRRAVRAKATASVAAGLMTTPALTVMPDTPLGVAARLMERAEVKRLPVVDELGRLIGVITRSDALRVYLRGDAEIREDVVREVLERVLSVEPGTVRVSVNGGVVEMVGEVDRRSVADIAVRLARAVPGVIEVVDRLTYDFDDGAMARSADGHAHPFEAEEYVPRVVRR
jgi:CBS domain-containing protein